MVKKENLTQKQSNVLKTVYEFIADNSYSPSVRNIAEILGFSSPKGVSDHLAVLEKKGYILKNSSARSIRLTEKSLWHLGVQNPSIKNNVDYLPLLGNIAAGKPIFAEENIQEYIPISSQITGNIKCQFLLTVRGDSMSGDNIIDGDMLIVKAQNTAENGEIVVALIEDDEAVVKRYYKREDEAVELRSSNPLYEPIVIKGSLWIQGKVIAVYRIIP
ncbi:MAG: transcriptional repressor LexA [Actinomycetota bacterium]|nr:transcriptional repressor LexA [Actinomycetota bacterium]